MFVQAFDDIWGEIERLVKNRSCAGYVKGHLRRSVDLRRVLPILYCVMLSAPILKLAVSPSALKVR